MPQEIIGPHLGPNGTVGSFNETSMPLAGQLGKKFWIGDRQFQFVKCHADTAYPSGASGKVAYWQDSDDFVVSDIVQAEGTSGVINGVAGVYTGTVTPGNYCVIQKQGPFTAVAISGSVVDGVSLIGLNIATGVAGFTADATAPAGTRLGRATSDASSNTANAILTVED